MSWWLPPCAVVRESPQEPSVTRQGYCIVQYSPASPSWQNYSLASSVHQCRSLKLPDFHVGIFFLNFQDPQGHRTNWTDTRLNACFKIIKMEERLMITFWDSSRHDSKLELCCISYDTRTLLTGKHCSSEWSTGILVVNLFTTKLPLGIGPSLHDLSYLWI